MIIADDSFEGVLREPPVLFWQVNREGMWWLILLAHPELQVINYLELTLQSELL